MSIIQDLAYGTKSHFRTSPAAKTAVYMEANVLGTQMPNTWSVSNTMDEIIFLSIQPTQHRNDLNHIVG